MVKERIVNFLNNNDDYSGTMKLMYEIKESIYLLELLLEINKNVISFGLDELNEIFYKKFNKAYTVEQFKQMSKVFLILKSKASLKLPLLKECIYGIGKITFVKEQFFDLSQCILFSQKKVKPIELEKEIDLDVKNDLSKILSSES